MITRRLAQSRRALCNSSCPIYARCDNIPVSACITVSVAPAPQDYFQRPSSAVLSSIFPLRRAATPSPRLSVPHSARRGARRRPILFSRPLHLHPARRGGARWSLVPSPSLSISGTRRWTHSRRGGTRWLADGPDCWLGDSPSGRRRADRPTSANSASHADDHDAAGAGGRKAPSPGTRGAASRLWDHVSGRGRSARRGPHSVPVVNTPRFAARPTRQAAGGSRTAALDRLTSHGRTVTSRHAAGQ